MKNHLKIHTIVGNNLSFDLKTNTKNLLLQDKLSITRNSFTYC